MISVCLATYNGEKYIKPQLDSVLSQLETEDEVIISDDGSTDHTLDIISDYKDSRIKVFHHEGSTITTTFPLDRPTHNFEFALHQATGDIIFLCDQDDIWLQGKVQMMKEALNHADLAVHDCIVVNEHLEPIILSYFKFIGVHQGALLNTIKATYPGCCMAIHRKVAEAAFPFPKTKVGHDLWLGIVADLKFKTLLVHQPLLLYRKHKNSMTTSGLGSHYGICFKISYRLTILWEIIKKWIELH